MSKAEASQGTMEQLKKELLVATKELQLSKRSVSLPPSLVSKGGDGCVSFVHSCSYPLTFTSSSHSSPPPPTLHLLLPLPPLLLLPPHPPPPPPPPPPPTPPPPPPPPTPPPPSNLP